MRFFPNDSRFRYFAAQLSDFDRSGNLLPELFGRVITPEAVFRELQSSGASNKVREWSQNLPAWIEVKQTALIADAALDIFDAGEIEAILLAQELSADLLLVDDKPARQAAINLGIAITGTLGILDRAAREGLVELKTVLDQLRQTSFRVSDKLIADLLKLDADRRQSK